MEGWKSLLRSRKVLLAALGVVQSLVLEYLNIPSEVWLSINALLIAVIAGIAHEDAASKAGRGRPDGGE